MNLLRALGSPRTAHAHRAYNRYTGGVERRCTLTHPPTRYARTFSSQATEPEAEEPVRTDEVQKEEDPEAVKDQIIAKLEEQIAEVKTKWQLTLAETDNLTKKMLKEIATTRETASDKMAHSLFPLSDTLEFCLRHRPDFDSEEHKDNVEAKGAFDGLESTKKQFVAAMRSVNINEIVPQVGDEFDPMMHNACFEIDAPENCLPGQIGLVIKTGWAKNNNLIRAADVGVAKAQPSKFTNVEDDDELDTDDEDDTK